MRYRYEKPIEHKRSKKYGNNYYQFRSRKLGRIVTAYSNLEYYNLIALEMNSEVEWYCEQPVEACVFDNMGNVERCYPDVYVYYRSGMEEIQEVKYSAEYEGDTEEVGRAWSQRRKEENWSTTNGMAFAVRTEKDLITGKSSQNLRYLCNRIRIERTPDEELQRDILACIDKTSSQEVSIRSVADLLNIPYGRIMDCIAYMFWKGNIDIKDIFSETALHIGSKIARKAKGEGRRINE